ncbi:MAG TPA: RNA polymerase sigma factor RpoD/SigA [Phycisphaerae bacterium]|nr:RNA polymerase sigma factor RpoD/SigA [Phycisphaerae bacterium]
MSAKSGMQLYVEAIQREPLLSAEEEKELARRIIRSNDAEARKKLIQSNLRLVVSVAKRYSNRGMSLLDLVSEGNLGLIQAVDAFNPSMNIRFSTYGSWWIKQSIRRAFCDGGGFVRVPSYMYERLGTWQEAYGQLQSKLGREPRIDEFAEHMKSSPEQAWAIHWAMQRSWSNNGKEAAILPEVAPDQKMPSAAEVAAWRDDLRQMKILLQKMDERAALILRLRYGLSGEEPMTLNDVGARIGVTRERVRQIEMEALTELQVCLSERNPQREMRKMQSRRGREGRSWMASA